MTCQECQKLFPEAYYRELDESRRIQVDEHVASCESCSAEYRRVSATLNLMDKREAPEPDPEFMENFWPALQSKLDKETQPAQRAAPVRMFRFPSAIPVWAYGVAAMFILVLGIYLGRTYPGRGGAQQETAIAAGISAETDSARRAIHREVDEYLDRSQALLVGMINQEDASPEIVQRQQHVSRELVQQAVYLKSALKDPDEESLRKLINDLEVVLMQLANYSSDTGIPIVELVRQGVDQKSILLKINIEQIKALHGRKSSAASRSRKSGI